MEGLTIKTIPFTKEEIDKSKRIIMILMTTLLFISYIRRKKLILVKQ